LYLTIIKKLRESLAAHIKEKYGVQISIALEKPPKLEMGEAASPVCFELAKRLKRAPRQIAQEISTSCQQSLELHELKLRVPDI